MLFNSFVFLFGFLPAALLLYFGLARFSGTRAANVALVAMSLVFYGYWAYPSVSGDGSTHRMLGYVWLLCASTTANFLVGRSLQARPRRWLLALAVTGNLAVLGYYKYAGFFVHTLDGVFHAGLPIPRVILPLAISFYTFTQIAFVVDAYRGLAAEMSFSRYALFVSFFPHLIAGPIVHHSEIMPQFARRDAKRWQFDNVSLALAWLSIGLFKKVAIADACAPLANVVFGKAGSVTVVEAWAGALAYTMQLYFDFSGYSDMAIGLSLLFNVRLPENFEAPYRAVNIVDFWRRWHMTLSRFLRDYLYIPLGGNRLGHFRRYFNLFATMAIGGLWHGAGWTFVIWGSYHGLLLIVCHLWKKTSWRLPVWSTRSLTFLTVLLGWVVFRASDLSEAGVLLGKMFDLSTFRLDHWKTGLQLEHLAGLLGLLVFVNVAPTTRQWIESRPLRIPDAIKMAFLFCVALFLIRNVELQFAKSEFIYFRF